MSFADRKDEPLIVEKTVPVTQRVPNFDIEDLYEDCCELAPILKDEFEPDEAMQEEFYQLAAQFPEYEYGDFVYIAVGAFKKVLRDRPRLINTKPPAWDKKGKEIRDAKLLAHRRRVQAEQEAVEKRLLEELAREEGALPPKDESDKKRVPRK